MPNLYINSIRITLLIHGSASVENMIEFIENIIFEKKYQQTTNSIMQIVLNMEGTVVDPDGVQGFT